MSRFLFWLTVCMLSACYGQEDEDGGEGSCRPNVLVPNAQICFANSDDGGDSEDLEIEDGKKVATLPALGKEWTITFDLQPSEMPTANKWYGILTVANSEGDVKAWKTVGNRNPGVFYHGKNKKILVRHFIGKEAKNLEIDNEEILAADKPTSFKISQETEDGKLMYKIEIGGEEKLAEEQTEAFEGPVNVWVTHKEPMPGVLKNFRLVLAGAAEEGK